MDTLMIANGERYWQSYFPAMKLIIIAYKQANGCITPVSNGFLTTPVPSALIASCDDLALSSQIL